MGEQQRTIQNLDVRVKEIEKLNHDLVLVNNDQKAMIANLQEHSNQIKARLAEMEFEKNMQIEELRSSLEEQKLAKDTELDEMKAKLQHTLDKQNLAKDTELDETKAKLQRKEKEFEVLTQEMFERSKSKFREIDVLKKKLSEAERSLNKFVEFGPPTTIHEASRIIESWKIPDWVKVDDIEQFKSLCDIHCQNEEEVREMTELRRQLKDKKPERPVVLPIQNLSISKPKSEAETQTKDQIAKLDDLLTKKDGDMESYSLKTCSLESAEEKNSVMSKLSEIEATVKQTQKEMQEFINFSQANSVAQSEIQSVKSHDSSTFTDSSLATNDSRRLMDYQVIQQALHEPHVDHQPDTASTCAADLSGLSPLKRRLNQMMDGFREIEDSPKIQQVYTGTKPKSKESTPTNIIPTAPPANNEEAAEDDVILDVVKTTSPLIERSQNVLFKFLPQLSQSVFGNLEETMMLKPCSASATPEESTPERDIPIIVQEQPKNFVNEDQDQFTDLVNWQKASIVSTVTEEGIVLTDDGRTMTEEEARPKCPICEETFDVEDVKTLEMHVEAHLSTNLYCPVCNASFGIDKRQDYQNHVQEHFADTDDEDEPTQNTGNSWFMDFD